MGDTVTLDAFHERIAELGESEFARRLKQQLVIFGSNAVAAAKRNAKTGPRVRSGRLRSSIRFKVSDGSDGEPPSVALMAGGAVDGGRVVYAGMQEFGGTVQSSRPGGFLRIPLEPALTEGGDRFGGPLRSYSGEGFFAFRAESGDLYIGKSGDYIGDGAPRAWYALKERVKVPRTLFLGRAMAEASNKLPDQLAELFRVALSFDRATA